MKRWKLIVGITLVFALGLVAGSLGTGLYFKHWVYPYKVKGDPKTRKTFVVEKLTRKLGLTENQKTRFEEIFDEVEKKRRGLHSELRKIRAESMSLMKKELTPDQQKKLDQLHQAFELRKKKIKRH